MSYKAKNSVGDDEISMQLSKCISGAICNPLSKLINMSLDQGVVSNALKILRRSQSIKANEKMN